MFFCLCRLLLPILCALSRCSCILRCNGVFEKELSRVCPQYEEVHFYFFLPPFHPLSLSPTHIPLRFPFFSIIYVFLFST